MPRSSSATGALARLLALERRHAQLDFVEIRRRVLDGESGAWTTFVERYSSTIYTIALHLARQEDDREEAAQDVYTAVLARLERDDHRLLRQFRGDSRFETYLFGAVRHELAELRRRRGRQSAAPLENMQTLPAISASFVEKIGLEPGRLGELVEQSLAQLEPQERVVLRLRFQRGLPLRRVAEILGWKDTNAAAYQITRILRKLDLLHRCGQSQRWGEAERDLVREHLRQWLERSGEE